MPSALITLLFVVLGCTACNAALNRKSQLSEKDITAEKLHQYERLMHVTFPASTRALNAAAETDGPDDAVFLKVEMDKQDLDTFVKNSPFVNTPLKSDERSLDNEKDLTWWNPDGAKTYKSGQVRLPANDVLNIPIDFDQDRKIIVYVLWYDT